MRAAMRYSPRMFENTIAKLEQEIQGGALEPARKAELLALLARLRAEVATLPPGEDEQARSVSGFAALSAHEATRSTSRPKLLEVSLRGLAASGQELELTHPRLAEVVNQLCALLSNMGI